MLSCINFHRDDNVMEVWAKIDTIWRVVVILNLSLRAPHSQSLDWLLIYSRIFSQISILHWVAVGRKEYQAWLSSNLPNKWINTCYSKIETSQFGKIKMSKSKNKIHGKSTFLKERQSRLWGGIIYWMATICECEYTGQLTEDSPSSPGSIWLVVMHSMVLYI